MRKILNFALFQAGWFACVLGGAHGMPVAAVAAAGAVIGVNLWWFSADRMSDLRLLLAVALIGFSVDTVNLWLGVFCAVRRSAFSAPVSGMADGAVGDVWNDPARIAELAGGTLRAGGPAGRRGRAAELPGRSETRRRDHDIRTALSASQLSPWGGPS